MFKVTNLSTSKLSSVNFETKPGQITAIIGDNGSGKSTLAKVLAGYYKCDHGTISYKSHEIGLLTQNPYLQFIGNTVFDELTYSLEQENASSEYIQDVLNNAPFDLFKPLDNLSGGEAQRLLIYKELVGSKKLLILDETLSNLDTESKQVIIEKLISSNKCIIFITNNLNDIKYADQVLKLENNCLTSVNNKVIDEQITVNNAEVSFKYQSYSFLKGLNIISGDSASGKTTLINEICFDQMIEASLIPQYPFEMVTTLSGEHLCGTDYAHSIRVDDNLLRKFMTDLSTGELVKVLIIEAIEKCNKVIILDESIEVLDKQSQRDVLELLINKFETIIIVSHNLYLFNEYPINVVEVK